jgi:CheY-like chemotaxis protein
LRQRILVVDDEKNVRTTLADILSDEGHDVVTAESGERALKLCSRYRFDVILLDVRMPGIDGLEALRAIRALARDVCIIMMSGYSIDRLEHLLLDAGAQGVLRKPLDIERVLSLIDRDGAPRSEVG